MEPRESKDIDYTALDYGAFKKMIMEIEPANAGADNEKVAKLEGDKAKLDQQIAGLLQKKAALQKQIDALEKK